MSKDCNTTLVPTMRFGSTPPPPFDPATPLPATEAEIKELIQDMSNCMAMLHHNLLAREQMVKDMGEEITQVVAPRMLGKSDAEVLEALDPFIARKCVVIR